MSIVSGATTIRESLSMFLLAVYVHVSVCKRCWVQMLLHGVGIMDNVTKSHLRVYVRLAGVNIEPTCTCYRISITSFGNIHGS